MHLQKNHASALLRPQGVDSYFKVEKEKNSIYGPFKNSPFDQTHYSPLMEEINQMVGFESLLTFHGL